jgi:hypothetical protein
MLRFWLTLLCSPFIRRGNNPWGQLGAGHSYPIGWNASSMGAALALVDLGTFQELDTRSTSRSSEAGSTGLIVGAVLGGMLVLTGLLLLVVCVLRRRRRQNTNLASYTRAGSLRRLDNSFPGKNTEISSFHQTGSMDGGTQSDRLFLPSSSSSSQVAIRAPPSSATTQVSYANNVKHGSLYANSALYANSHSTNKSAKGETGSFYANTPATFVMQRQVFHSDGVWQRVSHGFLTGRFCVLRRAHGFQWSDSRLREHADFAGIKFSILESVFESAIVCSVSLWVRCAR